LGRLILTGLAVYLVAGLVWAQTDDTPDNRTVLGGGNDLLASGSNAIRAGLYDEGIRLTMLGLDRRGNTDRERAAALSNLCAAYAAKSVPDTAVRFCTESLAIDDRNWRAFSNRSYAYWLKGMFAEAASDLDAAAAINPSARQVLQIRGMINESSLRPRITVEDHQ
jgi:tetratricopeptide (TPR) repeat protein